MPHFLCSMCVCGGGGREGGGERRGEGVKGQFTA